MNIGERRLMPEASTLKTGAAIQAAGIQGTILAALMESHTAETMEADSMEGLTTTDPERFSVRCAECLGGICWAPCF